MLHPYSNKFVIVFFDDMLVYSKSEEDHEKHLGGMLRLLRENKLYGKINNSILFLSQIHYLGYVVSKEGIVVDPENNNAIMEWPALKNVDEVRSFMGLTCY